MLETVKHLAIMNAAGLAGSCALFSSANADKNLLGLSAIFFVLGLLMAVADFYFSGIGYEKLAQRQQQQLSQLIHSYSFQKIKNAVTHGNNKKNYLFSISSCLGWLSLITAVVGGLILAIHLSKSYF